MKSHTKTFLLFILAAMMGCPESSGTSEKNASNTLDLHAVAESVVLLDGTSAQDFKQRMNENRYFAGGFLFEEAEPGKYFVSYPDGNYEGVASGDLYGILIMLGNRDDEDRFTDLGDDWVCLFQVLEDGDVPLCEWIGYAKRGPSLSANAIEVFSHSDSE